MEGLRILALDSVMIDAGIFFEDNLRHRVREGGIISETDIGLRDRRLAIDAGQDQNAWVSHGWLAAGDGHKNQVNRFIDNLISWDVDERSISEESSIEGREGMLLIVCQLGQEHRCPRGNGGLVEEGTFHIVGESGQVRFDGLGRSTLQYIAQAANGEFLFVR